MYSHARKHYVLGAISILVIAALILLIQSRMGKAQTSSAIQPLKLNSITSVTSSNPGGGISVFEDDSSGKPYTELSYVNDQGTADYRATPTGKPISVGTYSNIAAQTLTINGTNTNGTSIGLSINIPAVSNIQGNARLYVSDTGSLFYCQGDHDYTTSSSYPNDCDLTASGALVEAHRYTTAAAACGNNWCQTGETYTSCPADCRASEYSYTVTMSGTGFLTINTGETKSLAYNITQTNTSATGADSLSFSVVKSSDYSTALPWCMPSTSVAATTAGVITVISVTCTPGAADVGNQSAVLKVTSTQNTQNGYMATFFSPIFSFSVVNMCTAGQISCPGTAGAYCYAGTACPAASTTGTTFCGNGTMLCYDKNNTAFCLTQNTTNSCPSIAGGTETCFGTNQTLCYENGKPYCYTGTTCPAPTATTPPTPTTTTCGTGQLTCYDSTNMPYCYTGTACPASTTTTTTACNNNGVCEAGESTGSCPSDCIGTTPVSPPYGDCKANVTNATCTAQAGCKWFNTFCEGNNYVPPGTTTPGTTTPGTTTPGTTTPGTTTPGTTTPDGTVTRPSKECYAGETCASDHWCTTGAQNVPYAAAGTSYSSATWLDSCYFPDKRVRCVEVTQSSTNMCGPSAQQKCPVVNDVQLTHCKDANCKDIGEKGGPNDWCWSGSRCYNSDKTETTCADWTADCPSSHPKSCGPNDPSCLEIGEKAAIKDSNTYYYCSGKGFTCYNRETKEATCVKDTNMNTYSCDPLASSPLPVSSTRSCPAGWSECRPDDKGCTSVGDSPNPDPSAWCMNGKQCYGDGGLSCVNWNEECGKDTKLCRPGDKNCYEPNAEFTYSEHDYPWCADGMTIYHLKEWKGYCLDMPNDPVSMQTFVPKVKKGYGFCRLNDTYCLEPGESSPAGTPGGQYWCGWMSFGGYNAMPTYDYDYNAQRVCPQIGKEAEPPKPVEPTKPEEKEEIKNQALACVKDAKRLGEKVNMLLKENTERSSNDITVLKNTGASISKHMKGWDELVTSKGWEKLRQECVSQSGTWGRDLEPIMKRTGTDQAKKVLQERITNMRGTLDGLYVEYEDGEYDDETADIISEMLGMLDEADSEVSKGNYGEAKNILHRIGKFKRLLNVKLATFDRDFEEEIVTTVTKHIEEKLQSRVEDLLKKIENSANVLMELIEKGRQVIAEQIAALEKASEKAIAAVTKSMENATVYIEGAVQERVLERIDNLTATVQALEEEVAKGALTPKVQELNDIILENTWTAATANEIQKRAAAVLSAKAEGESSGEILGQIDDLTEYMEEKIDSEEEHRVLVDAGESGFVDAPMHRWDGGLMLAARNKCIARGRGDDPYRVDATRNSLMQETVALTIRVAEIPLTDKPPSEPVPGLAEDAWSVPYFATLQETGYDVYEAYNADTSRLEAAKMIYALTKDKLPNGTEIDLNTAKEAVDGFTDYNAFKNDSEAIMAIYNMNKNGLMQGYGEGSQYEGAFGAENPMTRNQLVTVMVRTAELIGTDPCAVE